MNNLLAQQILAARDKDFESWTNILFIVVIGIFWVVGGILKAKANKSKQQEQEQPGRKPPEPTPVGGPPRPFQKTPFRQAQRPVGRTPKSQPRPQQVQPSRRKIVRPQPAGRKPSIKTEEAIELPTLEALETPKVSLPGPQLQADLEELPEFTVETVEKDIRLSSVEALGAKPSGTVVETPQAKYLSEILLDYDDPEKLRRAILHYEILGKPLSLRGPSEHII
jgi:hypothetical protein